MAAIFEERGFGTRAEFISRGVERLGCVADLDPDARDLEGYLFPDTYALPRRTTAAQLVGADGRAASRRH